jgi:hypothetical protein
MTERPVGTLLKDLRDETQTLIRQEVELARVETEEKIKLAKRQLVFMGIGAALLLAGLVNILAVLNRGLTSLLTGIVTVDVAVWLAPLIISVVLLATGAVLAKKGSGTLKDAVRPNHTINEARRTKQWAQRQVRSRTEETGG